MNDTAYDPSYLDSMKLSGRYLFKLIARNCPDCFDTIRRYMKSDYRKYMDMGNPLYLCKHQNKSCLMQPLKYTTFTIWRNYLHIVPNEFIRK